MARKKKNKSAHEVVFHSYPKLIFVWPLIVVGFLLYYLAPDAAGATAGQLEWLETLGWFYLLLVLVVVVTLGVDLERNHAVFWLVVFCLFFFLGKWLADAKGFTLFGDIYNWLKDRNVKYDRGFGLVLSVFLAAPFLVMLLWARLQHKWRITHNEFEHFSYGRADDSLARGAKRVRSTYPDLLELLICGAGTLIVYSATGRSELRRIPHVPLLFLVRKRIDRLMEMTAITTTDVDAMADGEAEAEIEEDGAAVVDDEGAAGGAGGNIGEEKL